MRNNIHLDSKHQVEMRGLKKIKRYNFLTNLLQILIIFSYISFVILWSWKLKAKDEFFEDYLIHNNLILLTILLIMFVWIKKSNLIQRRLYIQKYLLPYDYYITDFPHVEPFKSQVVFKKTDFNFSLKFRHYIKGKMSNIPFTCHYIHVIKGYWILSFAIIFMLNFNYIPYVLIFIYIFYILLTYFKGDYYVFTLENEFPFHVFCKNSHFRIKDLDDLQEFQLGGKTVFTDRPRLVKEYLDDKFLNGLKCLSDLGYKVDFAYHQQEYHLAIKNKKSVLSLSTWHNLVKQIKNFTEINDQLAELIQVVKQINEQVKGEKSK